MLAARRVRAWWEATSGLAQTVVSRCRPAGLVMSTLYLRALQLPIFFVSSVAVTWAFTCISGGAPILRASTGRASSL